MPGQDNVSNKWTLWVALHGVADENTATIIKKVVYELPHTCQRKFVTAYPPFFSMCDQSATPFTVRCRVHWNIVLGMPHSEVDHHLVFKKGGNRTIRSIDVDSVLMDSLKLQNLLSVANKGAELQLSRWAPFTVADADPKAFAALGLEAPQTKAVSSSAAVFQICREPSNPVPMSNGSLLEVVVCNRTQVFLQQGSEDLKYIVKVHVDLPVFQASKSMMIDHIVYKVDPTEGKDTHVGHPPNFEITCLGLETSKVSCTVHWAPALGLQPKAVVHELVFDELGGRTSATIRVNARRLQCFAP